jgi:hypothetical protein
MRLLILAICLATVFANSSRAQQSASIMPNTVEVSGSAPSGRFDTSGNEVLPLTVPKGTALQVVLDREVRIQKVGQEVQGRVAEPIYAFDKVVVPIGAKVTGQITELEDVSGGKRFLDALNADFSPARKVQIEFHEIELADGRRIPIHTDVAPDSGQVIQFVTSASAKKTGVKGAASDKVDQAKQEAKQEWDNAMKQVHAPGKMHKIKRYAIAQLPVHPQYLDPGSVYFAELKEPLDFGTELLTSEMAAAMDAVPAGSIVHARLTTELNSATTQKGDDVEAALSEPLFDGNHLVLPQGTLLKGTVVQVRAARRLKRNGRLRMVFHELVLPEGIEQKISASLEGIQADKGQDVKLDSEGGAEANSPKTRYLSTGISVALALASAHTDADARDGDVGGNASNRVAGGAGGFKLVGIAMGLFVHSQPLGMAMGAYGASMSIYAHFISRGRDLVFPKNTAMEISIGPRVSAPAPGSPYDADPRPGKA